MTRGAKSGGVQKRKVNGSSVVSILHYEVSVSPQGIAHRLMKTMAVYQHMFENTKWDDNIPASNGGNQDV